MFAAAPTRARLGASGICCLARSCFVHSHSHPGCPQRGVEGEKVRETKGHMFKKRPSSNRTSRTVQKHSGTSSVSSTKSQVSISSTGMAPTRLPETHGRLRGSPKLIAQTISFKSGKPRGGRRKRRPRPPNIQNAVRTRLFVLRKCSWCALLVHLNVDSPIIAQGDLHVRGNPTAGHKPTYECLVSTKASTWTGVDKFRWSGTSSLPSRLDKWSICAMAMLCPRCKSARSTMP